MIGYLILGLGLVLLIEGLVYALAPSLIDEMLAILRALTIEQRRLAGLAAMALGTLCVWGAVQLGV